MKKPSIENRNTNPKYLRGLIEKIQDPTLFYGDRVSTRAVARRLGVPERSFQKYISSSAQSRHEAPYVVQYALECLASRDNKKEDQNNG